MSGLVNRKAAPLRRRGLVNEVLQFADQNPAVDKFVVAYAKPPSRDRNAEGISLLERALALDPRSVAASWRTWSKAARAAPIRGGHSRIRNGARLQSQLGVRILRSRSVQALHRVHRGDDPARGASHPAQPSRSRARRVVRKHRVSASVAITHGRSDHLARKGPQPHAGTPYHSRPTCLRLRAKTARSNAPPQNSPKPAGSAPTIAFRASLACGRSKVTGCQRSAACSRPLILPACARPECRSEVNPSGEHKIATVALYVQNWRR
jgi:hypothetical protein